tara:strand:- start:366 stop:824 length:459 start_codon:yes stop_codon:yes gene_type:complete
MDGLERFLSAQDGVYSTALAELRAGRKRTHWMWFIFPQLRGLGRSAMAERYGITSGTEAREYLIHPVLGPRLKDCVEAIIPLRDCSLHEILGSPDDLKFRSSMTLFAMVDPEDPLFRVALDRWCDGVLDPATLSMLGSDPEAPAWQTRDAAR